MSDQSKTDQTIPEVPPKTSLDETDDMPVIPYRVVYVDLPFYSDRECKKTVEEATIAVLEALDPDGSYPELDVVPTRNNYEPGQIVTWMLNNKKMWEESWYKNPESGQIEAAWKSHVEFIGQLISAPTLAENQKYLEEIEAKREAKVATKQPNRIN